jgi:two-component system, chemotaxis family, chemotaxis protein CheY
MITVAIIDDSGLARVFLKRCVGIAYEGEATFLEAENGRSALEMLRREPVDLVITDLTMPDMDGMDLVRRIQASPRLNDLPILVVTSAGNEQQRGELRDMGVLDILTKPITPAAIASALARLPGKEEA